jgi:hypothetical protein
LRHIKELNAFSEKLVHIKSREDMENEKIRIFEEYKKKLLKLIEKRNFEEINILLDQFIISFEATLYSFFEEELEILIEFNNQIVLFQVIELLNKEPTKCPIRLKNALIPYLIDENKDISSKILCFLRKTDNTLNNMDIYQILEMVDRQVLLKIWDNNIKNLKNSRIAVLLNYIEHILDSD